MAKRNWTWGYSPQHDPKTKPTTDLKRKVEAAAVELNASFLTPTFVKPPPKKPRFNYVIGITTQWRGRFFYFLAEYRCPGPNALSPTFTAGFARLEHMGNERFNLAYFRHTDEWWAVLQDQSLDDCLEAIRTQPLFQPPA